MIGLALFIFIAAIIVAVVFGLILPAIVSGLVSLVVHGNLSQRTDVSGRGLASVVIKIVAVIIFLGIVVIVLLPSTGGMHVLSPRSVCAANVRGIMQSMLVYAADNNHALPIVPFGPYGKVPNAGKVSGSSWNLDEAIRQLYAVPNPQAGSVQACLWILVLEGQVSPKQFICKSDRFADIGPAALLDQAGNFINNFQSHKQLSYSMAYQWNADGKPGAWWKDTQDARIPLMADMNPLQGTGMPARDMTPGRLPADNKTWNSGNHQGDGQNVGFADGHAEFAHSPNCGQKNDNIYTMSASPSQGPAQFGGIPAGKTAPVLTADKAPYDIIMLPVRNETTGAM
jgi:prepilin-type processing-associated H-X9-DG protein